MFKTIPEPEFPATGTARISKLLAQARRRRDHAYRAAGTEAGGGTRTGTPLDNLIEPPVRATKREPGPGIETANQSTDQVPGSSPSAVT